MNPFSREGPFRKLLRERMEKGPVLKKLRDQFFKAGTKIVDAFNFDNEVMNDIINAKALVVIVSPFLRLEKVKKFTNYDKFKETLKRGVKVIVVTRPAEEVDKMEDHLKAIGELEKAGIKVITQSKLHFKAIIIDNEILYVGSINPLSLLIVKYTPPDYMLRFVSEALVDEIIENAIGRENYQKWLK